MGGVPEHNPRFAWGLGPVSKQPCWEVCFLALKMPWETLGLGKGPNIFCLGGRTIHDFFCMYSSPSVLGDEKQQDKSWACWDRRFLNWIWWIYFIYWSHILGSIISLEKPSKLSIEHSNTLPSFLSFSSHFCPVISSDFCENGSPTFGVGPILSRFRIEPLETMQ